MPSAPAKARNMERQMPEEAHDETSSEEIVVYYLQAYKMQASYVEALQTAQTLWHNQRWVLSMPMCLCCAVAEPAFEVMITFGLRVRRFEDSVRGSTWTAPARYGAKCYKHAFYISLVQCAGIRRCYKGRKRWCGWNWAWKLEILSDLL